MKTAFAYVRCATAQKDEADYSIQNQINAIKEYAIVNKIEILDIYQDKSCGSIRPQFDKMMDDIARYRREVDYVIVTKPDQFSRGLFERTYCTKKLLSKGIKLLSLSAENSEFEPEQVILESLLQAIEEYQHKQLSRQVIRGMMENAFQGKHNGGMPPLGYEVDSNNGKYVISYNVSNIIQTIFSMFLNNQGYGEIRQFLNSNGFKTRRGNDFTNRMICKILTNEKYCGIYRYTIRSSNAPQKDIITIPDGMPAIISKEDFVKVQSKIKSTKTAA